MRTIAVINQKGGCGKTTTAINLAASLADIGQKTLLVDMDPQSHCALGLAVPEQQIDFNITNALAAKDINQINATDLLWQISGNLDLIPSTVALAGLEQQLLNAPDKDLKLLHLLKKFENDYDMCIIDCPPSIGLLTFNSLRAAQEVIVPVETGYFSLKSAFRQASTLTVMAERAGHHVRLHILPTMYDVRTKMAREIVAGLKKHFGPRLIPPIHFNAKLKEATSFGQPICEYDSASRGAQDFKQLAKFIIDIPPQSETQTTAIKTDEIEADIDSASYMNSVAIPVVTLDQQHSPSPSDRASELVQRARALVKRTNALQAKISADPDVAELNKEQAIKAQPPTDPDARVRLQKKLDRLYGVSITSQGALFMQPVEGTQAASIAGDFNNWSPDTNPMRKNKRLDAWEVCLPLENGRYRYRLIIDGKWQSDPHNSYVETNPFGELNSIVEIN